MLLANFVAMESKRQRAVDPELLVQDGDAYSRAQDMVVDLRAGGRSSEPSKTKDVHRRSRRRLSRRRRQP